MSRYTIQRELFGQWPVVTLADSAGGSTVTVACRGARLLNFKVPVTNELRDIADGYRNADALGALKGARFAVMVPFANRVRDARYRFDGETFDLKPGAVGGERSILHGFVLGADFVPQTLESDDRHASVCFEYQGLRPGAHSGYPFAVDVAVRYTLHAGGLDVEIGMRNVGERVAPCFCGWHSYFRLREDGIGECKLQLPARQTIRTDAALIPLPGMAAYASLDQHPELDFRRPRRIGDRVLDTGFTELTAGSGGRIRTHLRDPDSGLAIALWQQRGAVQVFTGDTLAEGRRRSVALEPMEAMTDAFNREDCAAAIALAPGASRYFSCGVEVNLP
jgi:aldose 1-epimerase